MQVERDKGQRGGMGSGSGSKYTNSRPYSYI